MTRTLFVTAMLLAIMSITSTADQPTKFSSKIGVHLIGQYTPGSQTMVQGRMPVLKILDPWEPMINAARDYKKANPKGIVVLRCYAPAHYGISDDPVQRAREYWQDVIWARLSPLPEADRKLIDFIEATNEVGECPTWENAESTAWFTKFSLEFTRQCSEAGFKPCLASIPVGNLGDSPEGKARILEFVPALRAAKKAGGAWSYHSYTIQYTTDPKVERFYSLRYRLFYDLFKGDYGDLADMPLILTEGGVDRGGNAEQDGWLARGSADRYKDWLKWFDGEIKKDEYVVGVTLFQNGDARGWKSFDLEPLADWFVSYWAGKG